MFIKNYTFVSILLALFISSNCFSQLINDIDIDFSKPRGFVDSQFNLDITTNGTVADNINIIYTTDGSKPTFNNGAVFSNPIFVTNNIVVKAFAYNNVDTTRVHSYTYLFLNDVLNQQGIPANYPSVWATGPAEVTDTSTIVQNADYDLNIDPAFTNSYFNIFTSIPTLSISLQKDSLFDANEGIYSNPLERGDFWQKEAAIEMFNGPDSIDFSTNCGIQINGASTRYLNFKKHSFKFEFKGEFGKTKLKKQLFGKNETDEFDNLILRMVGHSTPHDWNASRRAKTVYEKDQFIRTLQKEMGNPSANGLFVHVYLNSIYWGVYNLTERPDHNFMASIFGGDDDDYDNCNSLEFKNGDSIAYYEMLNVIEWDSSGSVPVGSVSNQTQFETLGEYLDYENFTEYILLNHFGSNGDWDEHNWWAGKDRKPGGKYKFFAWDSEFALYKPKTYQSLVMNRNYPPNPTSIHKALKNYENYRYLYGDAVQCNCIEPDGALHKNQAIHTLSNIFNGLGDALIPEINRWGGVRGGTDIDYLTNVTPSRAEILDDFLDRRIQELVLGDGLINGYYTHQTQKLYSEIPSIRFSKLGGYILAGQIIYFGEHKFDYSNGSNLSYQNNENYLSDFTNSISLTNSQKIYYTLNGDDPRLNDNTINPDAIELININDGVTINENCILTARVYDSTTNTWGNTCPRTFYVNQNFENIVINEIHYYPADSVIVAPDSIISGKNFSYIELYNKGAEDVDLSGVYFDEGLNYEFPFGSILQSNCYLTLAEDPERFYLKYNETAFDKFSGKLDNDGEKLVLKNANNNIIDSVRYQNIAPWPQDIEVSNVSISLKNANLDNSLGQNWTASNLGDSPNQVNLVCEPIDILINPIHQPCVGEDNGILIATVPFGGNYTVNWSTGSNVLSIFNITAGNYTLFVEDDAGCADSLNYYLESQSIEIDLDTITFNSSNNLGDIFTTNLSGNTIYYEWFDESDNLISTSENLHNQPAGNYYLVATQNNCSDIFYYEITSHLSECAETTGVSFSNITQNSIFMSWDLNADAINYTLKYKEADDANFTTTNTSANVMFLPNLNSCTEYEIIIETNCMAGVSTTESYFIETEGCVECESIGGLTSYNVQTNSGILLWDLYADATYTLNYRNVNNANWLSSETSFPLTIFFQLIPCTTYEWFVVLHCPNGNTSTSEMSTFTTSGCQIDGGEDQKDLKVENESATKFNIYPNPSTGNINLEFDKALTGNYILTVYNVTGKMVYSENIIFSETYTTIKDLSFLNTGSYIFEITNGKETLMNRFIINN